jgi:DNA (cytosine-5)-methyltransferase 1
VDKPKLLNLFSGAVCSKGYRDAGFHVTDVDLFPQPRHTGDVFIQADAIEYVCQYGWMYDAIHASPLCQPHSGMSRLAGDNAKVYPDFIPQTRFMLETLGLPYVIENVRGARKHLHNPIELCGCMFGLKTYRPRYFESNIYLFEPIHPKHTEKIPPAGRGANENGYMSICSGGIPGVSQVQRRAAMGVDWYVTNKELSQGIPPQFSYYIGCQLMNAVTGRKDLAA